jgi:hypothetical protein
MVQADHAITHRAHEENRPLTSPPGVDSQLLSGRKAHFQGVVEGLNNKAKVTMRKSYSFHPYRVLELALYHALGKLSEPESTHDFFCRIKLISY